MSRGSDNHFFTFSLHYFFIGSRTNLPKEIMGFPDFPIPESEHSYLPAKDMLAFLQLYADKHGVTRHIKVRALSLFQEVYSAEACSLGR